MNDFYEEKRILLEEILEKAGLHYMAVHMSEIEELNLIGSSPKTMLDGMPMQILRCLDTKHGIEILKDAQMREKLISFFRKVPIVFRDAWNLCQCLLWSDVSKHFPETEQWKELAKVFQMLKQFDNPDDYEEYKVYYWNRETVKNVIQLPLVPEEYEREELYEKADYIAECMLHEAGWNHYLYQQYARHRRYFEYHDQEFDVVLLKNLQEFWEESEKQHNCVWGCDYVEDAAAGNKVILSLRKNGEIRTPYVTMEIEVTGNYYLMKQAKLKYNQELDTDTKIWILDYCRERAIKIHEDCEDLDLDPLEKERRDQSWEELCFYLMD